MCKLSLVMTNPVYYIILIIRSAVNAAADVPIPVNLTTKSDSKSVNILGMIHCHFLSFSVESTSILSQQFMSKTPGPAYLYPPQRMQWHLKKYSFFNRYISTISLSMCRLCRNKRKHLKVPT